MRRAARLLLIESEALRPILEATQPDDFDRETVCIGWSVRDVLGHCGAALMRTTTGDLHRFTPEDNQVDVDERKAWPMTDVLAELFTGYQEAAEAIDSAAGALDGIGLGEWVHGGDIRDALDVGIPYGSEGVELAVELLVERSRSLGRLRLDANIDGAFHVFGSGDSPVGTLVSDTPTFVRLCGGRGPDPDRYVLAGCSPSDLVLFS